MQAWTFLDPEHALAQARAADECRLSGQPIGPLHGVPVGLKDIIDTADMPTENGSVLHAGRTPSRDAAVVALLRAAGAVIMGKTVTTEFATRTPGKTRNPHNPGAHAGRLVERLGGGGGGGHGAAGARQPDDRLDDPAGVVLRRVRLQADARPDPAPRDVPALPDARSRRTLRAHGRGHRAAARGARGPRRARSRTRARARACPYRAVAAEEPPLPPMFAFVKTSRWERVDADASEAFAELVRASRRSGRGGRARRRRPTRRSAGSAAIVRRRDRDEPRREWEHGRDEAVARAAGAHRARPRRCRARRLPRRARAAFPQLNASFTELFEQRYDAILTPAAFGTAPAGARVDRRSGLLRAVDALRHAGAQRAAHAGRQRPAPRRPARRPAPSATRGCSAPRAGWLISPGAENRPSPSLPLRSSLRRTRSTPRSGARGA